MRSRTYSFFTATHPRCAVAAAQLQLLESRRQIVRSQQGGRQPGRRCHRDRQLKRVRADAKSRRVWRQQSEKHALFRVFSRTGLVLSTVSSTPDSPDSLSASKMPRAVAKTSATKKVAYAAGGLLAILTLLHFLFNSSEDAAIRNAKWTAVPTSFRQKLLSSRTSKVKQRPPIVHPIPAKIKQARDNFEAKLARQSKTLTQAVAEYQKRYNMDPPKGFDEWFQFAKDNKVDIIDEYDQLMKDLDPWFQLSGEEIRRRCIQVGYLPSVDLVRVENGTTHTIDVNRGFDDSEVGARAKGFRVMLEKFQDKLPNMDFPINEKAEGRILVPWEQRLYSNLTADTTSKSRVPRNERAFTNACLCRGH